FLRLTGNVHWFVVHEQLEAAQRAHFDGPWPRFERPDLAVGQYAASGDDLATRRDVHAILERDAAEPRHEAGVPYCVGPEPGLCEQRGCAALIVEEGGSMAAALRDGSKDEAAFEFEQVAAHFLRERERRIDG